MSLIKYMIKCKSIPDPVMIRIPEKDIDDWKVGTDLQAGLIAVTYKDELIFFAQLIDVLSFLKSYENIAENEPEEVTENTDGQ